MKALYFNEFGNSDVLKFGCLPNPVVGRRDLLLKMEFIGLNYADIYRRNGTYHIEKHSPFINGYEGLGTVIDLGSEIGNFKIGDKIFFVDTPYANAELVTVPEEKAILVPSDLDAELVASIGLQGLTADFLTHDLGRNKSNDNVFVHGISGGVGQILSQMLTADGVNVYGVTSSVKKQQLALSQGAKKVFLRDSDWQKDYVSYFDTVYDGVGITLLDSISLIKKRGKILFFGMSGGIPPQVDLIKLLNESKSILTGDLWDYLTNATERTKRSARLFEYFRNQRIKISAPTMYPLSQGKEAYEFLESGKSIGKILLKP